MTNYKYGIILLHVEIHSGDIGHHAACCFRHLLLGQPGGRLESLVDGGKNQILEQLDVPPAAGRFHAGGGGCDNTPGIKR